MNSGVSKQFRSLNPFRTMCASSRLTTLVPTALSSICSSKSPFALSASDSLVKVRLTLTGEMMISSM